jgi:hypothetical protein
MVDMENKFNIDVTNKEIIPGNVIDSWRLWPLEARSQKKHRHSYCDFEELTPDGLGC